MPIVPERCTEEEFETAIKKFGFSDANVERLRRVLIRGEKQYLVARDTGITQPTLSALRKQVMTQVKSDRSMALGSSQLPTGWPEGASLQVPAGWQVETFVAPKEFLAKVRQDLDEYLAGSR